MAKINISIPDDLLAQVDGLASELDRSRSGLIQEAAATYVARVNEERERAARRVRAERAIASAREIALVLDNAEDSTAVIRTDRERDGRTAGER